jgi:hypothetical protein
MAIVCHHERGSKDIFGEQLEDFPAFMNIHQKPRSPRSVQENHSGVVIFISGNVVICF